VVVVVVVMGGSGGCKGSGIALCVIMCVTGLDFGSLSSYRGEGRAWNNCTLRPVAKHNMGCAFMSSPLSGAAWCDGTVNKRQKRKNSNKVQETKHCECQKLANAQHEHRGNKKILGSSQGFFFEGQKTMFC
jgi:hypothetical protein